MHDLVLYAFENMQHVVHAFSGDENLPIIVQALNQLFDALIRMFRSLLSRISEAHNEAETLARRERELLAAEESPRMKREFIEQEEIRATRVEMQDQPQDVSCQEHDYLQRGVNGHLEQQQQEGAQST